MRRGTTAVPVQCGIYSKSQLPETAGGGKEDHTLFLTLDVFKQQTIKLTELMFDSICFLRFMIF